MGPEELLFLFGLDRGEAGRALMVWPGLGTRGQGPAGDGGEPGVEQGEGGEGVLGGQGGAQRHQAEQETEQGADWDLHFAATRLYPASQTFFRFGQILFCAEIFLD